MLKFVITSVLGIVVCYLICGVLIFKGDFFYQGISEKIIGMPTRELDKVLNISPIADFEIKNDLVYPFKKGYKGCGRGYSLNIYYDERRVVTSSYNKIFYICDETILFSKVNIISEEGNFQYFYIWPLGRIEIMR